MFISIVKVENNRIAKFAEFPTEQEAQEHCVNYGGFVHESVYSPDLWVDGETVSINSVVTVAELAEKAVLKIDADTDAIYAAAIGNREPEYREAEAAANAYKDAGYAGDVPSAVDSWATAKGWTAQQAADDILAAADQLNTAKLTIRAQRLLRKEQVRSAETVEAVDAILQQWDGFVTVIKGQLGL